MATPGTIPSGIYDQYITNAGYEEIKPNAEILKLTEELIYDDIKKKGQSDNHKFHQLIEKMSNGQGADIVILGCTELSYAQEMSPETNYPIIDAQEVIVNRSLDKGLALRDN